MSEHTTRTDAGRHEPIKAVPVRHPGRWVAGGFLLVLVAMLVNTLFSKIPSPNGQGQVWRFRWDIIGQYVFSSLFLHGAVLTIELTLVAMAIGISGGLLIASLRLSPNPLLSGASWVYTWLFRGTPVLVQMLLWYAIATIYPTISIGIPFGPGFWTIDPNTVITPFVAAAVLGLGLNEAAYMAEIVRGGILAVDVGQNEAASSLGMGRILTLRRIVIPQAMRVIIPPTGNEFISMLKTSSLASFLAIYELTYQANELGARTYLPIPFLMVASIWYLSMTTILSIGQYFIERHYARGQSKQPGPSFLSTWGRMTDIPFTSKFWSRQQ